MTTNGDSPWPQARPPEPRRSAPDASGADGLRADGLRAGAPGSGAASGTWGAPAPAPARDQPGRPNGPTRTREAPRRDAQRGPAPDRRPPPPDRLPAGSRVAPPMPRSGRIVDASGQRVRVRVVERFPGQRVRQQTGPWRRIRSALALVVAALIVGAVLAAALSTIVWGLSVAVHHASTS